MQRKKSELTRLDNPSLADEVDATLSEHGSSVSNVSVSNESNVDTNSEREFLERFDPDDNRGGFKKRSIQSIWSTSSTV